MQSAPQELLKQYVRSQKFTSTADIMEAMKDMFRDVIQNVMEVEMEDELGRRWRTELPQRIFQQDCKDAVGRGRHQDTQRPSGQV